MADAIVTLLALAAVPLLLRLGVGGSGRSAVRVRVRVRVAMRHRHPRLWWGCVLLGTVLVSLAWLVDSCGGAR